MELYQYIFDQAFKLNETTKAISMEESLELLREAADAELIHSTMNIQNGNSYICNCCTCCCGVLKELTKWKQPNAFISSNYRIEIDESKCIGCGKCLDRCQFNVLSMEDKKVKANERCISHFFRII